MPLDKDGQKRLKKVVKKANGDIANLPRCIEEVIRDVLDLGRKSYLRNVFSMLAPGLIRKTSLGESKRYAKGGTNLGKNSAMMADTRRREKYHQVRLAHDE